MGYYWITTELVSGKKSYVSPGPIALGVFLPSTVQGPTDRQEQEHFPDRQ